MNEETLLLSDIAHNRMRLFYGREITTKQEMMNAVYLRIEEIVDEEELGEAQRK